jgi:hypothetical protein
MSGKGKPANSRKMHATILAVVGIIAVIIGAAIATIPGTGLRGSGLGTAFIVIGVVLLFIAILRLYYKRA